MGLWLVLFLIEHLFVNSQAAGWFGEDGSGFVRAVNAIQQLPYLKVIELSLLGVPFLVHALWGLKYLFTAKSNVLPSDGTRPSLSDYPQNRAYTWQRITSWILLFGIIGHVGHMRFLKYPEMEQAGGHTAYVVQVSDGKSSISVSAPDFGTAILFVLRDTFKDPLMVAGYTLFVSAATFHAFHGLWTFLITWGVSLTTRAQELTRKITLCLMGIVTLLGWIAIWGIYLS